MGVAVRAAPPAVETFRFVAFRWLQSVLPHLGLRHFGLSPIDPRKLRWLQSVLPNLGLRHCSIP